MVSAERDGLFAHRFRLQVAALFAALLIVLGCGDAGLSAGDDATATDATKVGEHVVMHYDPGCGCCSDWAAYMREQGFVIELRLSENIAQKRRDLGVPGRLASCHTAEIGGYLIEGHVPADAVRQLLEERPEALGISAPGMPWGSPGMEMGERIDTYPILLFDAEGNEWLYARYHGHERL